MAGGITFDGAPDPGSINFGVGQPSADLLPVALVESAARRFLGNAQPLELNYGARQGDVRFRTALAEFLAGTYGFEVEADSLFVTAGNSQALDFVCAQFSRPGDVVLVEEPSYFLAFRIFRDHGLKIVGVPLDGAGMDLAALEAAVHRHRPRLVYTIPSYQNPTGQLMPERNRARLVELARENGFTIVADEVYQPLWYGSPPPPPLAAWSVKGPVLSLGSFSKILAPGMRLGWIQAGPEAVARLNDSGVVTSGGSFNHFSSLVVRHAMTSGALASWVEQLRLAYAQRLDAMDAALHEHLGDRARWLRPGGGYFFWVELDPGTDSVQGLERARSLGTGFQPGAASSCTGEQKHCIRLSFAHYGPDAIREGMARLAGAL